MNYWTTKNHSFNVNIAKNLIRAMKSKGARYCKMGDNSDINNEASSWWEDSTFEVTDQSEATDQSEVTDQSKSYRKLKQDITVITVDGDSITGYITHWVDGPCSGTNEVKWFIIQPGKYPTKYILTNEM